jgi:hypothetical protein
MNGSMHRMICLVAMSFAFAVPEAPAQGVSIESVVPALTKRAIETAPHDFTEIRGKENSSGSFELSPDCMKQTGAGIGFARIDPVLADDLDREGWEVNFGVSSDWNRDEVSARVQKLLGPVIPQDFVFQGIEPPEDYDPDVIEFGWKGPDNVAIRVYSFVDGGKRHTAFTIRHQLPR